LIDDGTDSRVFVEWVVAGVAGVAGVTGVAGVAGVCTTGAPTLVTVPAATNEGGVP